jgi:short subunit dehydrogenase-like uncharacterized protein
MTARPYNVVVWGATGFTGKLVCEHIAKVYQVRASLCCARRPSAVAPNARFPLIVHVILALGAAKLSCDGASALCGTLRCYTTCIRVAQTPHLFASCQLLR